MSPETEELYTTYAKYIKDDLSYVVRRLPLQRALLVSGSLIVNLLSPIRLHGGLGEAMMFLLL